MAQIVSVFRQYCGSGIYPLLFLAALIWLLFTEKRRLVRIMLIDVSLVILVLFFLPPFKALMDVLDEGTYYRVLWLLPMTAVIAYACVRIFEKNRTAGFVALAVLIQCGNYVYDNVNVTKAQNRYHMPNAVIAICNEIMPEEDEERVWAVFPEELIYYVRQYSSEIQMPYGREMLEPQWLWNWDTHPIYKVMREDTIDLDALAPLLEEYYCHYLILNRGVPVKGDFEENHLTLLTQIEAYDVYRNETVEIFKKRE